VESSPQAMAIERLGFALDVHMIPLTGTVKATHMQANLDIFDFYFESEEVEQIQNLGAR
jgi:diketogulonate reductase-like aldo/keto reductase